MRIRIIIEIEADEFEHNDKRDLIGNVKYGFTDMTGYDIENIEIEEVEP